MVSSMVNETDMIYECQQNGETSKLSMVTDSTSRQSHSQFCGHQLSFYTNSACPTP